MLLFLYRATVFHWRPLRENKVTGRSADISEDRENVYRAHYARRSERKSWNGRRRWANARGEKPCCKRTRAATARRGKPASEKTKRKERRKFFWRISKDTGLLTVQRRRGPLRCRVPPELAVYRFIIAVSPFVLYVGTRNAGLK